MNDTATRPQTRPKDKPKTDEPKMWRVVLLDDDHHTYEYVMRMMQKLFRHPLERAFKIAQTVDSQGRAVCLVTHKEHAELKRDQIHAFGPDPLMAGCKGAMSAVIEPVWGDDDDDDEPGGGGADN
ncbi:MAG: ATP-dependent Clp protease adaptor ClpS [Phycisphaeraceae bacterium]|nr:MAG: ATP-dependent Clp protease adaptor ClpS [Phycisphaeraceae bacterium]